MSPKKSGAVPHEVTVREDRKHAQSSLKVANDESVFSLSAFPMSMSDNILPFLPPCNLFIFVTTINSLNTILYLCAFNVPSPVRLLHLVNTQTHEFCLIH